MVDGRRRTMEERRHATGSDDAHRLAPLALDPLHQPLDQGDVAPEDAGLHGGHRVFADGGVAARPLDGHPRQLGGGLVQGFHRQIDAGCDGAAFHGAVRGDHVEGGGGAAIDDDQVTGIDDVGADRVDQAIHRQPQAQ